MSVSNRPASNAMIRWGVYGEATQPWIEAIRRWFRQSPLEWIATYHWEVHAHADTDETVKGSSFQDDIVLLVVSPKGIASELQRLTQLEPEPHRLWLAGGVLTPPEQRVMLELGVKAILPSPTEIPPTMTAIVQPWLVRQALGRSHCQDHA